MTIFAALVIGGFVAKLVNAIQPSRIAEITAWALWLLAAVVWAI